MLTNIKFIGHSCFLINGNILIDPFIYSNPTAQVIPEELKKVKDILLTHAHADHLGDAIEIAKKGKAKITAIFELANYCASKGLITQGCNIGGKVDFDWGYAHWLQAQHSSSLPDGSYGGVAASILLNIDGKKILHLGDTGLHSDMKMIGDFYQPEIVLIPIGGFYTMGINEAVEAIKWLKPKIVIPMHYDTFSNIQTDVNQFQYMINNSTEAKCIVLKPSRDITL